MPNRAMAVQTTEVGTVRRARRCMYKILVAIETTLFQNLFTDRPHLDGLFEILQRERLGMQITILGFAVPFADEVVRQMAIVTRGKRVMTPFLPPFILRTHNVAIYARFGIVAEIRSAFRIVESKTTDAEKDSTHREGCDLPATVLLWLFRFGGR